MMVEHSTSTSPTKRSSWTYVSLMVIDGSRHLKPTEVAFDRLCFKTPPQLVSAEVEIILVNGQEEQRHRAAVLPHSADALRIPIELLS